MIRLSLASKAKTLEILAPHLTKAKILPLIRFSVNEYQTEPERYLSDISRTSWDRVIVRSSSHNEDNEHTSNAGGFDSIMNVSSSSQEELDTAIRTVIESYGEDTDGYDEVFVQPMLRNVTMSGVVFSADLDTLSPYYIINYDESGSTSSVTGGSGANLKTFISFKANNSCTDPKLRRLIESAKECERIFDHPFLDIEFAFSDNELYILQVRAIVTENKESLAQIDLSSSLRKIHKKIQKLNAPHPNLLGDKTIFGVMPDWNPAEIIGLRPKRLALSLYKELITDETWAYQRDNYGYRNLRSHPLLISFLGVPFIDVRVSFNSFVPKALDDAIASKLVNYYLSMLSENTDHHDKIEFQIVFSCFFFGIGTKLEQLSAFGFTAEELASIENALLDLTNTIIDTEHGLYKKDLHKIEILTKKYDDIVNSELPLIDKIYWLVQDVKRYGTLPFAGIARAAFIAVQLLQSFVEQRIISQHEYDAFLKSLNTVSKNLSRDTQTLEKDLFLERYGHLRPGTYDILSLRYDEAYEAYFGSQHRCDHDEEESFSFSDQQISTINALLSDNGLDTDFENLITFIKESIEGREYAKFVFTKHLSQILKYIEQLGEKFGFGRDALAYLDIQTILSLYSTLDHRDVRDIIESDISKNRQYYQFTKAIKLPSVIVDPEDIYSFYLEPGEANFITHKQIESEIVLEAAVHSSSVEGKIVCIRSADPGYDYLFSKNIGGLLTCYGGANSHMAIRCAEMGIPAVIGCGESRFDSYCKAAVLEIDALNKQVRVVR